MPCGCRCTDVTEAQFCRGSHRALMWWLSIDVSGVAFHQSCWLPSDLSLPTAAHTSPSCHSSCFVIDCVRFLCPEPVTPHPGHAVQSQQVWTSRAMPALLSRVGRKGWWSCVWWAHGAPGGCVHPFRLIGAACLRWSPFFLHPVCCLRTHCPCTPCSGYR